MKSAASELEQTLQGLATHVVKSTAEAEALKRLEGPGRAFLPGKIAEVLQESFFAAIREANLSEADGWKLLKEKAARLASLTEDEIKAEMAPNPTE